METRKVRFSALSDACITAGLFKYLYGCFNPFKMTPPMKSKIRYEILNCLERFALSLANAPGRGKSVIYRDMPIAMPYIKKLKQEFDRLRESTPHWSEHQNLMSFCSAYGLHYNLSESEVRKGYALIANTCLSPNSIYISGVCRAYRSSRVERLITMSRNPQKTMAMLLRYASVVSGGQQWGIPFEHFKIGRAHV